MICKEFVKAFAPTSDVPARRDRVSLTGKGAGTMFSRFFDEDAAMPVWIILSVLEK